MNKYDVNVGQIVIIEKKDHPYEGFYGRVTGKQGLHNDGRDAVMVELVLRDEWFQDGEIVGMPIELDYDVIADDDGYWDESDFLAGVPSIMVQFNDKQDVFAEQFGALPLEDEILHVVNNGDHCRALRYIIDIATMLSEMHDRIQRDDKLLNRK